MMDKECNGSQFAGEQGIVTVLPLYMGTNPQTAAKRKERYCLPSPTTSVLLPSLKALAAIMHERFATENVGQLVGMSGK